MTPCSVVRWVTSFGLCKLAVNNAIAAPLASRPGCNDGRKRTKLLLKTSLEKLMVFSQLTSIVNLPVSNSVRNGSFIGSMLSRSSSFRINSCCSNSATARCTSNLRAKRNFSAVDGDIVFRSIFLFSNSINSLTACLWKRKTNKSLKEVN